MLAFVVGKTDPELSAWVTKAKLCNWFTVISQEFQQLLKQLFLLVNEALESLNVCKSK